MISEAKVTGEPNEAEDEMEASALIQSSKYDIRIEHFHMHEDSSLAKKSFYIPN